MLFLVLRKILFTLLPRMPTLLRNVLCSKDFCTTLIANTPSWLSGKGQNPYLLGTGKRFTDSSTTSASVSRPANVDLPDARLQTPLEHESSDTLESSLERLRIPIPGSARTTDYCCYSCFQIFQILITSKGTIVTPCVWTDLPSLAV